MKDINISFRSNETTIIYGPNGSGKTTLMKIAALLYPPSEGEVLFNGENFWKFSDKKKIQMSRSLRTLRRAATYIDEGRLSPQ
ncbi:MAG: ATP-binding cassette domain-containing protein [Thermoprotei archaeon]|jgi:ABC-type cobalamin/Fe3+-siderophores transport system ATPase subunit|nr:ATP-binding cassette domain-containing protein [Thermoprotei archaeon]